MPSTTTRTGETIARTLLAIKPTGTITMPEMYAIWAEFGIKPTELVTALQQVEKSTDTLIPSPDPGPSWRVTLSGSASPRIE